MRRETDYETGQTLEEAIDNAENKRRAQRGGLVERGTSGLLFAGITGAIGHF
jgi:hypothetical protein